MCTSRREADARPSQGCSTAPRRSLRCHRFRRSRTGHRIPLCRVEGNLVLPEVAGGLGRVSTSSPCGGMLYGKPVIRQMVWRGRSACGSSLPGAPAPRAALPCGALVCDARCGLGAAWRGKGGTGRQRGAEQRHVSQHQDPPQLRAAGDRGRDPRLGPAVRAQAERLYAARPRPTRQPSTAPSTRLPRRRELLASLVTSAPPRDRAVEAAKARASSANRFGDRRLG